MGTLVKGSPSGKSGITIYAAKGSPAMIFSTGYVVSTPSAYIVLEAIFVYYRYTSNFSAHFDRNEVCRHCLIWRSRTKMMMRRRTNELKLL